VGLAAMLVAVIVGTIIEAFRHRRRLRARRERPCGCRAAEQRDEHAPLHLITLLAHMESRRL
jgi:hypothetical protein